MQDISFQNDNESKEVNALTDIALKLHANSTDTRELLLEYESQINLINRVVIEPEHYGLLKLSSIINEGIKLVLNAERNLTENECGFLKKIPDIFNEYLLIPTSKLSDAHLLSHLKDKTWVRPLTESEDKEITDYLLGNICLAETPCDSASAAVDVDELDVIYVNDSIDLDNFVDNVEDIEDIRKEPEVSKLSADSIDLSDFMSSTNDVLDDENSQDTVDISEFLFEDDCNLNEVSTSPIESTNISINADQKELIDLINDEITDIIEDRGFVIISDGLDENDLNLKLISIAEQIENISNAVELIGLEGIAKISAHISNNIHTISLNLSAYTKEHARLIEKWPVLTLNYLHDIGSVTVSDELLNYSCTSIWPDLLSEEQKNHYLKLLVNPKLKEEEKDVRQIDANPDDISLVLPEDVNPELLEGLLQDLPFQSEEFSTAIQNLQKKNNPECLEIAQRIAHTLKGAGNVVGVKGIANLTHHLEDILEIQSKAGKYPSRQLVNILIDAADCLEGMSEALLGIDDAPDNALQVYQQILNWANKLDTEGATDASLDTEDNLSDEALTDINEDIKISEMLGSSEKVPLNIENMLRIPAKLADDLLRIAGENMISSSQIQEYIRTIQHRYKSLKLHNQSLQKLSYELEHIVDVRGVTNNDTQVVDDNNFDPLELDQYHELHSMSRQLVEIAADSIELTEVLEKDFAQLQGLVVNQDRLQKENEELVLRTRMVPVKTIVARLKRGVKQACRLTNKQVEIDVEDNDTYMDSEVLNGLIEPLMHVLRNSVDHGIENADIRKASNKPMLGHINLAFMRRGDQVDIKIIDDGAGLNLQKIQHKALLNGLVDSIEEVTTNNVQKFIFHPGFTTSESVSQVSGRGIGLDVVYSKIRELKGTVEVSSDEGKGCRFTISLPISSFSVHSLLVRIRQHIYAFSNRGIEEILYPGLGELLKVGDETLFKLGDVIYKTREIESLLNLPNDKRKTDRKLRPVVLIKDDIGTTTAVIVQDVVDSREVVVKSMGPYIPKIQGVIGATVLGDGSIAPVLDMPELLQLTNSLNSHGIKTDSNNSLDDQHTNLPYVLVVDDSLSARKSLAQFVQDLGITVRTARDGMEAVSLIEARMPDLVLVDMEMPRMNGLELTSHIRAEESTKNMPVIMITSRSTEKHRKTAMDKGVSHYMVKPFAEEELANQINLALKPV